MNSMFLFMSALNSVRLKIGSPRVSKGGKSCRLQPPPRSLFLQPYLGANSNRRCSTLITLLFVLFSLTATKATAQSPAPTPQTSPTPTLEKRFLKNIIRDQEKIWTSPLRLRAGDAKWLTPLGLATAGLIATDRRTARSLGDNRSRERVSHGISLLGSGYGVGGIAGAFYLFGLFEKDERARETGLLGGEALIDSGIVTTVLKTATGRSRPLFDNGRGRFFNGGNSFPSGHSAASWALAAVVAEEYQKKPWVRFGAYGAATAISVSRFTGRNHFLSDALVGSVLGYCIGHYVYRTHHDFSLDANLKKPKKPDHSKLFPDIIPSFDRQSRTYGANLRWDF